MQRQTWSDIVILTGCAILVFLSFWLNQRAIKTHLKVTPADVRELVDERLSVTPEQVHDRLDVIEGKIDVLLSLSRKER